ncbi:MAG: DUF1134 domain-containing protein [Proteobacteria bacterium]|nr:DUF1134 domain-containing protein [Pseudomonadota bacterium]
MRILSCLYRRVLAVAGAALFVFSLHASLYVPGAQAAETFSQNEILAAAENLFGATSKGLASVVEKVFQDLGEPNGYIVGEELSGAFFVGLRYGRGQMTLKGKPNREVFWQGPSVGFDFGGNASKSFVLVYDLKAADDLYGRYPGVDGSFYFVAGVGANYQRGQTTTLVPIRTGVGLRAGANIGYLNYTRDSSWFPL